MTEAAVVSAAPLATSEDILASLTPTVVNAPPLPATAPTPSSSSAAAISTPARQNREPNARASGTLSADRRPLSTNGSPPHTERTLPLRFHKQQALGSNTLTVMPTMETKQGTLVRGQFTPSHTKPVAAPHDGLTVGLSDKIRIAALTSWDPDGMASLAALQPGRAYNLEFVLSAPPKIFNRVDTNLSLTTRQILRADLVSSDPNDFSWPIGRLSNFVGPDNPNARISWTLFHHRLELVAVGAANDCVTFQDVRDAEASVANPVLGILRGCHARGFVERSNKLRPTHTVSCVDQLVGSVWSVVALPGHEKDKHHLINLTTPKFDEWQFLGNATPEATHNNSPQ